jgi:hypothetical protein
VNRITQLSAWVSGHADNLALSAAVLTGVVLLAVAAVRTRRAPVSRRLVGLSVALTTGMSADSMWRVAGHTLGMAGAERMAFFAFGEVALIAAASGVSEALRELQCLATADGGTETERGIRAAQTKSARTRARGFALLVWVIAVGVGAAATTAAGSRSAAAIRLFVPILVAGFWWVGLDRSGLAVTREAITSLVSWRRLAVFLHLAQPGTVGLEAADRERRLNHLAGRLFVFHQARPGTWTYRWSDWRVSRADRAARRHLDADGRRYITTQLSTRYALRDSTSPAALSTANPWAADSGPDRGADSGQVIDGTVVDRTALPDSATGQRRAAPDSRAVARRTVAADSRTAAPDSRTVVPIAGRRTGGPSVEEMAAWLSGQPGFADRLPGRPTVVAVLRGQYGSCSTGRARDVMARLTGQRTADSGPDSGQRTGQRTADSGQPTADAEETAS